MEVVKLQRKRNEFEWFDMFWREYPRRVGKGAARPAFAKALKKATFDEIMKGLSTYRNNLPSDAQFIPHPSTWLNQERWADEYETPEADRIAAWKAKHEAS